MFLREAGHRAYSSGYSAFPSIRSYFQFLTALLNKLLNKIPQWGSASGCVFWRTACVTNKAIIHIAARLVVKMVDKICNYQKKSLLC